MSLKMGWGMFLKNTPSSGVMILTNHTNHPQSIELAPLIPLLGNHSLDDPSHRTPRHSEIFRYGADVRPLCQPRYLRYVSTTLRHSRELHLVSLD